ncbi:DUF7529 family protein [Natronorubrum sulfidifaciens]|uniref:Uncharacterized protein n=1 Tax=Natronorubrum sulfidifaciens JCM 14089 TaxID=1230460 RepID=L9WBF4_9EURY|nr:hypothetical protein [Natronorubrum sulfidifaciens]ELY46591.1 hypothetical protein C495_05773 [Natronorubrum sulfidifaciens JCM 14089]
MTDDRPDEAGVRWTELLEDATTIAEEYRENGWDAIVLEPTAISPIERADRLGLDVVVSSEAYDLVEALVEDGDVTITAADVYYRPPERDAHERIALVVERDDERETAIFVPLTYNLDDSRSVFETALAEEELLVYVTAATDAEADRWVSFSHEDPSLFLEEADVRSWGEQ